MTIWVVIDKFGRTLQSFMKQSDARLAQLWYRKRYPLLVVDVLPREVKEKWVEPE